MNAGPMERIIFNISAAKNNKNEQKQQAVRSI
jgi:hypothetical protein